MADLPDGLDGPRRKRHWLRWLIGGLAVIVAAAVAGPFVFIHFVEGSAPAPFRLRSAARASATASSGRASTSADAGQVTGTWTIAPGSQVGYRVLTFRK